MGCSIALTRLLRHNCRDVGKMLKDLCGLARAGVGDRLVAVVGFVDLADSSFENLLRRHQGDALVLALDEFDDALKRAHSVFFREFLDLALDGRDAVSGLAGLEMVRVKVRCHHPLCSLLLRAVGGRGTLAVITGALFGVVADFGHIPTL
jgi:hypothetical protein